ncbi:Fe-S protein assembly co-chaperone HscB [Limnoglobus roseus]|nr:Fe-S protein assembly co-chaperone HscB [Limnoglobus roseus]
MSDYYERLGLPRRFSIDEAEVERRYLAQSRQFHPDFHGGASDADQLFVIEQTASLNQAYTTLKDPFRRAEYLLSLLGGPTAGQEKSQDQSFLMQMMETREQMDEIRAAGGSLSELEADLMGQFSVVIADVASRFAKIESQPTPLPTELVDIRRHLNAARTIQSLLRDLRGTPDRG